jgi:RHS repeat-associated protein
MYIWDSRNRLSSVTDGSGTTAAFKYDFQRNLIEIDKTAAGSTTAQRFVIDGITNVASLTDAAGLPVSVLTGRSLDAHIASMDTAGNVSFVIGDPLNSTVGVTSATGALSSQFDYEPYGQTTGTAPSTYPFTFTGRVPVTGSTLYFRNRFYDTAAGRFLSEDPIGYSGGDYNLYRYVRGGPTNAIDPTGLKLSGNERGIIQNLCESTGAALGYYYTKTPLGGVAGGGLGYYFGIGLGDFFDWLGWGSAPNPPPAPPSTGPLPDPNYSNQSPPLPFGFYGNQSDGWTNWSTRAQ